MITKHLKQKISELPPYSKYVIQLGNFYISSAIANHYLLPHVTEVVKIEIITS